jgi:hypothetical protein
MDTVTLVRSAVRGLLKAAGADPGLAAELRGVLHRDDDYAGAGKPACDWDDEAAREALVDALARDARAVLRVLDGREPEPAVTQAAALLAAVTGQDLEEGPGGVFRIARRVAPDRVLPAVGPQARHGHKTAARGFDGYKGHVAVDPDAEIITATAVTPGNSGDAEAAAGLLADLLPGGRDAAAGGTAGEADAPDCDGEPAVYGDAACGPGELIGQLDDAGIRNGIKCQPPAAVTGHFPKDQFAVDLETGTVTCPAGVTAPIRPSRHKRHAGAARFGTACRTCPLAAQCTKSRQGRGRSATSCAAATAAAVPASAARPGSPPTSPSWPPRSASPASPSSASPATAEPGRWPPARNPGQAGHGQHAAGPASGCHGLHLPAIQSPGSRRSPQRPPLQSARHRLQPALGSESRKRPAL